MNSKLVLSVLAYQKMKYWVEEATGEISGLGFIEVKDREFIVKDVFLLPQKNGYASTDIDAEEYGKAMFEHKDNPYAMKFWWHSHAHMSAFWSGTDTQTIQELAAGGWFIATVINKKNESRTMLYQSKPIPVCIDMFPTEIETFKPSEDTLKRWKQEFDDKCQTKTTTLNNDYTNKRWNYKLGKWEKITEVEDNEYEDRWNGWHKKKKSKKKYTKEEATKVLLDITQLEIEVLNLENAQELKYDKERGDRILAKRREIYDLEDALCDCVEQGILTWQQAYSSDSEVPHEVIS